MTVEFNPVPNITCDNCGEFELFVDCPNDFSEVIRQAKAAGWELHRVGEYNWSHICPDCQGHTEQFGSLMERYEP